jgi:hypothetical protein
MDNQEWTIKNGQSRIVHSGLSILDCPFLIIHSWLSILDCSFLIVHSWLSILDCPFLIVHSWLFILDCSFLIVHSWLFILDCPFLIVHSWLFILDCSFLIVHSWLFILDCPFLIVHSWLERTIKNEQSKDTDNIGHKTQNGDKQKDNQEWTIQRHRQHWSQDTEQINIREKRKDNQNIFLCLVPNGTSVFILCLVTNVVCVFGLLIFDCPFVFL